MPGHSHKIRATVILASMTHGHFGRSFATLVLIYYYRTIPCLGLWCLSWTSAIKRNKLSRSIRFPLPAHHSHNAGNCDTIDIDC
jgi:hypothetical protein